MIAHRMGFALYLLWAGCTTSSAQEEIVSLSDKESEDALVQILNTEADFVQSKHCNKTVVVEGQGFDMRTQITWSCVISIPPERFAKLIEKVLPPILEVTFTEGALPVCPTSEEFPAAIAYAATTIENWDINETVAYTNNERTKVLACHKVLVVP